MTDKLHWTRDPANKEKLAAAAKKGHANHLRNLQVEPGASMPTKTIGRPPLPGTTAYNRLTARQKMSAAAKFRHAQRKAAGLPPLNQKGVKDLFSPLEAGGFTSRREGGRGVKLGAKRGPYKKSLKKKKALTGAKKRAWITKMLASRKLKREERIAAGLPGLNRKPVQPHLNGHAPSLMKSPRGFAKETVQGFAIVGAKQELIKLDEKREQLVIFIEKMEQLAHRR